MIGLREFFVVVGMLIAPMVSAQDVMPQFPPYPLFPTGENVTRVPVLSTRLEVVGYLFTTADGTQYAVSTNMKIVGHYSPASDHTYDDHGVLVSVGNTLTNLLPH